MRNKNVVLLFSKPLNLILPRIFFFTWSETKWRIIAGHGGESEGQIISWAVCFRVYSRYKRNLSAPRKKMGSFLFAAVVVVA